MHQLVINGINIEFPFKPYPAQTIMMAKVYTLDIDRVIVYRTTVDVGVQHKIARTS